MNKSKLWKTPAICAGVILFLFIFVEVSFLINQPFVNTGCTVSITDKGFYIEKVFKDSPAYKAGLTEGTLYTKLNGQTVDEFKREFHQNYKTIYKTGLESYLKFEQSITFSKDDSDISFYLQKQPILKQLKFFPPFLKAKFIISIFLILTGISCTVVFNEDKKNHSLIYCLYCAGIGLFNAYNSLWQSETSKIINLVLFDISSCLTLVCLLYYLRESLKEYSLYKRVQKILTSFGYAILTSCFLKYLLIWIFRWDVLANPFDYLTQTLICITSIPIAILTIITFIKLPSQTTYLFRFLMIGICLSTIPSIIYYTRDIFTDNILIECYLKTISIVSFSVLPFSFFMSILQVKFKQLSKIVIISLTLYIYVITAFYLIVLLMGQSVHNISFAFYFTVVFSPILFMLLYIPINKTLIVYTKNDPQAIKDFKDKMNLFSDVPNICKTCAEEIRKIINPQYIFFQSINEQSDLYVPYIDKFELSSKALDDLIYEADSKKSESGTNSLFNGGFYIPLYKNDELYCRVFVGPKVNKDEYMPSELAIINSISNLFFQTLLYKEKVLLPKASGDKTLNAVYENGLQTLSNLIETRYIITNTHIKRTSEYARLIAKAAKDNGVYTDIITNAFIENVSRAAQFHDVGKIVIADKILKKPGKLTKDEFEQVKIHTTEGKKIIQKIFDGNSKEKHDNGFAKVAAEVALSHHEWWNGTGYPQHLEGQRIPLSARIMAIADVFDTLISQRWYKSAITPKEAFKVIEEDAGIQFDPDLVQVFLDIKKEITEVISKNK